MLSSVHQVIKILRDLRTDKTETIYRAVIKSIIEYISEVCTLSRNHENTLTVWKRKTLREIFGPVKENGL